ncbi:MAG: efflux RND transporter permease subunit [Bacteroidota bacterium]
MSKSKRLSEQVIRNFPLTTLALKNKNTVYLLILIILGFGIYTYRNLPKELFPEIVWPQIMVNTVYMGNSPVDIENLVTRPLEKELESVRGLKELTSISASDASMIFVEFNTDVDLEDAKTRVKDAVDMAKNELPPISDVFPGPNVFDIDLSEFPIININLSGDYSVEELNDYAEYLEDELEEISEVSKVEIEGVNEREIKVNIDMIKMEALDVTFNDIATAIQNENVSMSGGEILLGKTRRTIRIDEEFDRVSELEDIIVKKDVDNIIYLNNVAEVIDGYAEPSSFARLNHQPVVSVQVIKKGGENLLSATNKIMEKLDQAKENQMLPRDVKISITNDQSEMVKMQLNNLENSIYMGVIFVIMVLFFFLGLRNALFVGLAIPMSMLLSFIIIGVIDFRINMIVLFSLILALGMLVDNAIVVVENIYRFVDEGYKPFEAARQAVGEIAVPIITSTATTLAAFLPLALWQGIVGEFMKYLPITLIIVLTSSLFVALVLIPVIAATFIRVNKDEEHTAERQKKGLKIASIMIIGGIFLIALKLLVLPDKTFIIVIGNLLLLFGLLGVFYHTLLHKVESWFKDVFLEKLENYYLKTLAFSLRKRNPVWFLAGTAVTLILTIMFFFGRWPDVLFFPDNDPTYINVIAELPVGTDITGTNEFMKEMEKDIFEFLEPHDSIVESVLTTVGKGNPNDFSATGKPNEAIVTISFVDWEDRGGKNTSDIMNNLSETLLGRYPGVQLEFQKDENGPPTGRPINVEIIGQDFDQLIHLADTLQTIIELAEIEGIEGLKMNISTSKPELTVDIDRNKAQMYELSTQQIALAIRQALFGQEVSDFKVGEDDYPIMIRLKDEYRYNLSALQNLKIPVYGDGPPRHIPISAVADFNYTSTFSSVRRKDMDRVITLYSNIIEGYNANSINQQIERVLEDFDMPAGYDYAFTGEQQEQDEASSFLLNAFLVAFALILIILVSQFNSLIRPGIIMASVVFSTIGVFGGLATFNMDFIIIMTGIGIISLAGVVVNNAIVLIDYIDLLKARRRKELELGEEDFLPVDVATECIIQGGKTRLRPVLLTAITTILGLLPLALGINFDFAGFFSEYNPNFYVGGDMVNFWGPMSWTVIFGLAFSTFLTLVIVPVMYRITTILQKKIVGYKNGDNKLPFNMSINR